MQNTKPSFITASKAESIVDKIRHDNGLGGAYHVEVRDNADGTWTVTDGLGHVITVRAMGERAWRCWYEAHYGDVIADRHETSEA